MALKTYDEYAAQLESPERAEVVAAAHGLGDLGDRRAVPLLIMLLQGTDDPVIRNAAAVGLRELGDARAIAPLIRLLRDPKTEGYRGSLLYALEPFDCGPHLGLLVDLIVHGGFEVSRQAALLLDGIASRIDPQVLADATRQVDAALPTQPPEHKAALLRQLREWLEARK